MCGARGSHRATGGNKERICRPTVSFTALFSLFLAPTEEVERGSTEEDGNAQSTSAFNASVQLQDRHPSEKDR